MPDRPAVTEIDALDSSVTYHEAERLLRRAEWTFCGAGDWAFALAAPAGDIIARISPFDPVGPYTARLYSAADATGRVPRLLVHRRLVGGGDLQVMERLDPAPEDEAREFLAHLVAPVPEVQDLVGLPALAEIVMRIHARAERELPWCGPLDTNPSNVMRARDGRLVLTDPYYADGPELYRTAEQDPNRLVALIPQEQRRFMTDIPLAWSGPWPRADRDALRERIRRADELAIRAAQAARGN